MRRVTACVANLNKKRVKKRGGKPPLYAIICKGMKKFLSIILIAALSLNLFAGSAFAYGKQVTPEYSPVKSKTRVWLGAILMIAGGFLAYDGFSKVRSNVTDASFMLSGDNIFGNGKTGFGSYFTHDPEATVYKLYSAGMIRNIGNVDLRNVRIEVRYKLWEGGSGGSGADAGYYPPDGGNYASPEGFNLAKLHDNDWDNTIDYSTIGSTIPRGPEDIEDAVYNEYTGKVGSTFTDNTLNGMLQVTVTADYDKKYKDKTKNPFQGYTGIALLLTGGYLIVDYIISTRKLKYYMQKHDMNLNFARTSDQVSVLLSKRI
jgi:hypothetical protein